MNALKSMMKATARVRRDGAEAEVPAEELVVGDVVLLAAGDQVPADGRIIEASALQIDESALTGESVPAVKDTSVLSGHDLSPGEQSNMAFMNTPVTHGSGTLIVTGTGADTELGKISGMLSATDTEQSPLTKELNRLTLWIAGAAGLTMVVMFVLGRARGQAWDALFVAAVSLAIAAIPEALPTVTQVILSLGSVDLAERNAIVKELPSVETLGFTSAINSDKTGTLTMNQMTAVEVRGPDRPLHGHGHRLRPRRERPPRGRRVGHHRGRGPALPHRQRRDDRRREGGGRPHRGRPARAGAQGRAGRRGQPRAPPRLAALPFDPGYKLMATFNAAHDATGRPVVRCFVKGAAPAVMARAATALSGGRTIPWDADLAERAVGHMERMERERTAGHGGGVARPRPGRLRRRRRPAGLRRPAADDQPRRHGRPATRASPGPPSPMPRPRTSGCGW